MMNERKVPTGILGFPVAPMDDQGRLDAKAFEQNVRFLVEEGLSSIFVCCGSGEFHALSLADYEQMVEVAVSVTKGKVPVYSGVGGNISYALELARLSEKLGADGYLILPPYLIEPEQEGLVRYISNIVESTDLNAIIYQRDNCVLGLKALQKLIEYPQVVGFKDGLGNMELNVELTQSIGQRLAWLNGMPMAEVTMPAYYSIGFTSYSSAISNYIPHISRLFYEALLSGNNELLHELYTYVILPIANIRKQRKGYAVALIKAGMQIIGQPVGTAVRPPLIAVEQEHYMQLERILQIAFDKFPKPSST
ncbi:5-dehydro-4-deoxyglucarate dehydratase [Paenibacillus aestuarii]|uniref:Probable 5-dehydro-4-deoxyglucarate dehydratase n=1 Tax=Paenibacillus aestuarii TaxID=516965 RepID=A0ABW0K0Y2_9BACL|nr:5-dehydro-4-deoxyglucarate dehydratase [Paenibacillus aestuarii]